MKIALYLQIIFLAQYAIFPCSSYELCRRVKGLPEGINIAGALKSHMALIESLQSVGSGEREAANNDLHARLITQGLQGWDAYNELSLVDSGGKTHRYLVTLEVAGEENRFLILYEDGRYDKENQRFLMIAEGNQEAKEELICRQQFFRDMFGSDIVLGLDYQNQAAGVAVYKFLCYEDELLARRINSGREGPVARNIGYKGLLEVLSNTGEATLNSPEDGYPVTSVTLNYRWAASANFPNVETETPYGPYVFAIFPRAGLQFQPTIRSGVLPPTGVDNPAEFHTTDPVYYGDAVLVKNEAEFNLLRENKVTNRSDALMVLGRSEEEQRAWELEVLEEARRFIPE